MDGQDVLIKLSHDQALVLSDWLARVESTEAFRQLVDDPAVWSALHRIGGTIDKTLPDLFAFDYKERLRVAQERLIESMGNFGAEPAGEHE